jgi:hypothetical protein
MDTIPDEIKDRILQYLTDEEYIKSGEINRDFNALATDERQWKERTYRKYGEVPRICDSWRLTYRDHGKNVPSHMTVVVPFNDDMMLNNVIGIYYPHDEEKITSDIYDYMIETYGDPPATALLTDHYMDDNPDSTFLLVNPNPNDRRDFQRYMRRFISRAVNNYDSIAGDNWYISIISQPVIRFDKIS